MNRMKSEEIIAFEESDQRETLADELRKMRRLHYQLL